MTRWPGLVMGAAVVAAALAATPPVRAKEDEAPRKVEVFRFGAAGARLGVVLDDVKAEDASSLKLAEERGAVIKEVERGSAAEKAGVKEGDVVLSYQGEKVWSAAQFRRLVRETPPGRHVTLEVSRAGAIQRLSAVLAEDQDREMALGDGAFRFEMPAPPLPPMPPMAPLLDEAERSGRRFLFRDRLFEGRGRLGLTYQPISGQLARYFKVDDGGLLVTEVEADGPAARGGVRAGDVIVKFNGKAITGSSDLRRAVADAAAGSEVTLTVERDGRPVDVKVTLRGDERPRGGHTPA